MKARKQQPHDVDVESLDLTSDLEDAIANSIGVRLSQIESEIQNLMVGINNIMNVIVHRRVPEGTEGMYEPNVIPTHPALRKAQVARAAKMYGMSTKEWVERFGEVTRAPPEAGLMPVWHPSAGKLDPNTASYRLTQKRVLKRQAAALAAIAAAKEAAE